MRLALLCLLLAAGLFAACKDSNNKKAASGSDTSAVAAAAPQKPQSDLSKGQTDELMNLLAAYYSLKDALVATDGAKADGAASKLLSAAELFRNDIGNQPQATEIHPQLKRVMSGCDSIIDAKGEAIEAKRQRFASVSDAMFKILKKANLKHAGVYQQFCPMAMNDRGAYWLSSESEIKNPYYGNKMLECGEVRDSL